MIAPGTQVAGYRVDGVLGQGGMGVVYRATQISLERTIALKVLAEALSADATFRERFRREGLVQAAIDHPHIVPVYEAGESPYGLFLAMRLVQGANLKELVVRGELDARLSVALVEQVAEALEAAHEAGLVHRDIKPQNILVAGRRHAYLADFGLTKALGTPGLTRTGQFLGTIDYISPEQIRGEQPSERSDIYSLAAVLFECLTGRVPFARDSDAAVLFAHLSDPPPSLADHRDDLPAELDEVLARALAKEPADRFPTAAEFSREAAAALAVAPPPASPAPPAESSRRAETKAAASASSAAPTSAPVPRADPAPAPTERDGREPSSADDLPILVAPPSPAPEAPAPVARETVAARPAPATKAAPTRPETRVAPARRAPKTAPKKPRPGGAERRRVAAAAGAVALLAAVAIGSWALGTAVFADGGEPRAAPSPPAQPGTASEGPLTLTFPSAWERVDAGSLVDVELGSPLEVAPRKGPEGAGLAAGTTQAEGPTLLPPSLRNQAGGAERDAVRLGDYEAYRYRDVPAAGGETAQTIYVIPASEHVVTLVCTAPASTAAGFFDSCERVAGSLVLEDVRPHPLGPSPEYARAVDETVRELDAARTGGRARMAAAKTSAAQAAAAQAVAGAYRDAAARLGGVDAPRESAVAHREILAGFGRGARAYRALAAAARGEKGGAYERSRADVQAAERATRRAIDRLRALGYEIA